MKKLEKWEMMGSWLDNGRRWRFTPAGDPLLTGDAGRYYAELMHAKRVAIGPAAAIAASKFVGWEARP